MNRVEGTHERDRLKRAMKEAFWKVSKEEGFAVKSWKGWRRRSGAWETLYLYKRGSYHLHLRIRLDRPDESVLTEPAEDCDVSADLERLVEIRMGLDASQAIRQAMSSGTPWVLDGRNPALEARARSLLASQIQAAEIPYEQRAATLAYYLRETMPWFEEYSSREAIERCVRDESERIRMGGVITKTFYDDFMDPRV